MILRIIAFTPRGTLLARELAAGLDTLEDVYEPYLMQLGFLTRTPRGRCVTPKAYQHLGMTAPGGALPGQILDQFSF